MNDLLGIDALMKWTGYTRSADVHRWLDDKQIEHFLAKDGKPCTTLQAINDRLIGRVKVEGFK